MTSRDFCYWLQGFFEIGENKVLSHKQVDTVKRHLAMVFKHEIDPSFPADIQGALNEIHNSTKPQLGDDTLYRC